MNSIQTKIPGKILSKGSMRVASIFGATFFALAGVIVLFAFLTSPARAWESQSSMPKEALFSIGDSNGVASPDLADTSQGYRPKPPALATGIIELDTVASWFASDGCDANGLTWGDLEGDGDLDLAVQCNMDSGNVIRIYLNTGQALETSASWESDPGCVSPAWGDLDGDGDLDLAARCPEARVYLNQAGSLQTLAAWEPVPIDSGPIAWGDMDGNGFLDLAIGQAIYLNTGGSLSDAPSWTSPYTSSNTLSISWGDMDQDGDLDFAASTDDGYIRIYQNTSGLLETSPVWQRYLWPKCIQIAWGDMSGDGFPELACSGTNLMAEHTYVYSNTNGTLSTTPYWQSYENHMGFAVDWGDVDSDGDLDLAVGNSGDNPERIYLNTGTGLLTTTVWETSYFAAVRSLAWGDVDGDGDLDLAVAAYPPRLHLNRSKSLLPVASQSFSSAQLDRFYTAWGDIDNDGDLDLAMGVSQRTYQGGWGGSSNLKLYLNQAGELQTSPSQNISLAMDISDVAWGDLDGDGYLDLAVGITGKPNLVYRNNIGSLNTTPAWTAAITLTTTSMAWGDVDGDGDLDLAVGSNGGNRLHLNQAGTLEDTAAWSSADSLNTQCVSWGDVDGDGDLDLAAANRGGANVIYLNINGSLQSSPGWTSTEKDASHAVAWGDVDGDGDLDLAVGNHDQPIKLYLNQDGALETTASWMGWHADAVYDLAWGDVDGDGDLDLASAGAGGWYGNLPSPDRVYLNQSGTLQNTEESIWNSIEILNSTSVALGDFDNDGDIDVAFGPRIYRNQRSGPFLYPQKTESLALSLHSDSVPTFNQSATALATADFYALPGIRDTGMIPISYTLFSPNGFQIGKMRAFYSKDGGDNWQEAIAAPGTQTTLLGASVYPTPTVNNTHVYSWDVFNSGLFGRSDDVVVRLEASPVSCCDGPPGSYQYLNQTAGPYQRPYYATIQTFPFRVRGTQVRVMYNDAPVEDAMVYHIPVGQTHGNAISDNTGHPYKTDILGYLQGRGEIEPGDHLIALFPAEVTDKYTLYYTNATPTNTGLQAYIIPDPIGGAQTLMVSDTHPLMLFNLDISLEWDARDDGNFLDDLADAISSASAVLYDVSDGQIALGEVRLYMDRQNWTSADIVIYAQSGVRPRASMGGVVNELTNDIYWNGETITNAYGPGQIRIGPNWDPFGTSVAELTPDWQRALAHELSHYLLFLPDNYLGVEPPDNTPITTDCWGSFMTNTYDDDYSELLTPSAWTGDCLKTIAQNTTGRTDWETVERFYTALHMPGSDNPGPASMPLQVTHVSLIEPSSSPQTLAPRYFDVRNADSRALLAVPRAQGYLFKSQGTSDPTDDRLIALGATTGGGDRVKVRGAGAGDRLCILGPYDPASNQAYLGCRENLGPLDASVYVAPVSDWNPNIAARAVTSVTLQVTVSLSVPTDTLNLQFFPAYGEPGTDLTYAPTATLTASGAPGVYSATLELDSPSFEGWLRVWIPDSNPPREALSQLFLSPPWGPNSGRIGADADRRAWGANARQLGAPAASGDGQVTIFNLEDIFADTGTVSLQAINNPPGLYPWLSLVGQAYRFKADAVFPRAIAFEYLQREAPPGYEHTLRIYFSPDEGASWLRLDTDLDLDFNRATAVMPDAPNQGQGIYALVASLEIPLQAPGWNLFAYPLPGSSPVETALASLSGYYSTVYGHVPLDSFDPWRLYDVDAPDWVNDLTDLEFGHGYWISATQAMTLYLNVEGHSPLAAPSFLPYPPSTLYGKVLPGEDFSPSPGITVTAWIAGQRCGQGFTKEKDGQIVYVVDVNADGPTYPDCGTFGKTIVLTVDGHLMAPFPPWNNARPREIDLAPPPYRLFLPLAIKPSEPFPWP